MGIGEWSMHEKRDIRSAFRYNFSSLLYALSLFPLLSCPFRDNTKKSFHRNECMSIILAVKTLNQCQIFSHHSPIKGSQTNIFAQLLGWE